MNPPVHSLKFAITRNKPLCDRLSNGDRLPQTLFIKKMESYQTSICGSRKIVIHLDRRQEPLAAYFSDSDPFLAENAESRLSSFDLQKLPNLDLTEKEFDDKLLDLKNIGISIKEQI
jgi:hypothetical protein